MSAPFVNQIPGDVVRMMEDFQKAERPMPTAPTSWPHFFSAWKRLLAPYRNPFSFSFGALFEFVRNSQVIRRYCFRF